MPSQKALPILLASSILSVILAACGSTKDKNSDEKAAPRVNADANYFLGVFGDSVASGMFADTQRGKQLSDEEARHFVELYRLSEKSDTDSDAFYREAQKVAADPDASAYSGTAAYALSARIAAKRGVPTGIARYAVSGSRALGLPAQIAALAADNNAGLHKPELAIVHIGANDFCAHTTTADFEAALASSFDKLKEQLPASKVVVAAIPPVPTILSLPDGPSFDALGLTVSCAQIRSVMKLCEGRPIAPGTKADAVKADNDDLTALNSSLKAAAAAHGFTFAAYDASSLTGDDLAVDCFHPGAVGHEKLSGLVWPAIEALVP